MVGNVVSTADPTGGAPAWRLSHIDPNEAIGDISCPSVRLCVAVEGNGGVFTSRKPAGSSAWTFTAFRAFVISRVACTSTPVCVGIGDALRHGRAQQGYVFESRNPTGRGSGWTARKVDTIDLSAVSCASTSLCVAVDGAGNAVVGRSRKRRR
jgi:hypothetical protein